MNSYIPPILPLEGELEGVFYFTLNSSSWYNLSKRPE
jgi:hypothetical protein